MRILHNSDGLEDDRHVGASYGTMCLYFSGEIDSARLETKLLDPDQNLIHLYRVWIGSLNSFFPTVSTTFNELYNAWRDSWLANADHHSQE